MDSPLLPTIKRNPDLSASPTGLMSNMSLEPMSPGDSFMFDVETSRPYGRPTGSTSSAAGVSPSKISSSARSSANDSRRDVSGSEENTPQAPRRAAPRFSLFAPGASATSNHDKDDQGNEGDGQDQHQQVQSSTGGSNRPHDAARDDKLRESLYELRQMNEVFEGFLIALEASKGHNERLRQRVNETSMLLEEYTSILGQQEHTLSLVRNPNWNGGLDDVRALQEEEDRRFAEEQAALEAEQARREEAERQAEEAKRQEEREAARASQTQAPATRGVTRGRGATRGLARGSGIPAPTSRTGARPPSASGIRKPSAGLGGQYSHVKGSGYGPAPRKA